MNTYFLHFQNTTYKINGSKIETLDEFRIHLPIIKEYLKTNDNCLFCILYADYRDSENKDILEFIKINNIKKVIFFVEDVLRLYNTAVPKADVLESYHLWSNPDTATSPQLDLIKKIVSSIDIDYRIFMCEYKPESMEKNYNFKIDYYDYFSAGYICNVSNHLFYYDKIKYKISNFNLRPEPHRYYMANLLNIENDSIVTCNWKYSDINHLIDSPYFCINKFPNDFQNKILDAIQKNNCEAILWDSKIDDIRGPDISINRSLLFDHGRQGMIRYLYQETFLNVISETRYDSPWPNFTEKTIKSILVGRPFVLLAAPGTLNLLKKLGFKTFNDYWDESYDNITDPFERFMKVYDIAKKTADEDFDSLLKKLKSMKDILDFNAQHLKNVPIKMLSLNENITN